VRRLPPGLGIAAVVVVVLGLLFLARGDDRGGYLDPRGTNPDGARALLELVGALGGETEIVRGVPGPDVDTALVLVDQATEEERDALLDWAEAGGRLVVADPFSALTPVVVGGDGVAFDASLGDWLRVDAGVCDIAALADVGTLRLRSRSDYVVADGERSCVGSGASAFVVERPLGSGAVVAVGAVEPFLNRALATDDNALLAAGLLVPSPGTRFAFVEGFEGLLDGETSLWGLVAPGVRWGLLLAIVAAVVFAVGRSRRLGRPVLEPLPVELRGAELVVAVGNALERNQEAGAAAERIRAEARRRIAARHGLPPDCQPTVLASVVADRHGVPPEELLAALVPRPVAAEDLLAVTAAVDRLERRVLGGASPPQEVVP